MVLYSSLRKNQQQNEIFSHFVVDFTVFSSFFSPYVNRDKFVLRRICGQPQRPLRKKRSGENRNVFSVSHGIITEMVYVAYCPIWSGKTGLFNFAMLILPPAPDHQRAGRQRTRKCRCPGRRTASSPWRLSRCCCGG